MEPRYKLKTAATFEPVDIAALKRNLHIVESDTTQDTYLQEILSAVIEDVQTSIGRQLARATYTGYLDEFPDDGEDLDITLGPVAAVTSVKYYDADDVLTTMSAADYQLDNIDLTARIRFLETYTLYEDKMNAIEIEFTTGWATAGAIPKELRDALILLASDRYLNPENAYLNFGASIKRTAADQIMRKYRVQRY